jgi:hypothetical protein
MAVTETRETTPARDAVLVLAGFASGALAAVAIAMVGAVGRERGGEEATWLHLATLVAGMCAVVTVMAVRGKAPGFPRPLNRGAVIGAVGIGFGTIALISVQGIAWYYLLSGVFSVAVFLLMTWLLVRVNLAFFFASNTLGTVAGSLVLDEIGAFGAPEQSITLARAAGVVLIAAGVVAVRTAK